MFVKRLAFVVTLIFATTASAAELGAATFSDTHIRPSNTALAVGFFTVTSAQDDAIVGLKSDCCKAVELHRTERINGNMAMRRISEPTLRKGKPMKVQPDEPGGLHLMLVGLKAPLDEGSKVNVTFTFKKAGEQTVAFPVYADGHAAGAHAH